MRYVKREEAAMKYALTERLSSCSTSLFICSYLGRVVATHTTIFSRLLVYRVRSRYPPFTIQRVYRIDNQVSWYRTARSPSPPPTFTTFYFNFISLNNGNCISVNRFLNLNLPHKNTIMVWTTENGSTSSFNKFQFTFYYSAYFRYYQDKIP